MKKRILPLLCGAYPYLYILFFLLLWFHSFDDSTVPMLMLYGLILLSAVLCLIGFLAGMRVLPEQAAAWGFAVKLAHIPFYLLIAFLVMILPIGFVFFFFLDVLVLISGTGFGLAAVLRARKENRATTGWTVLHTILHCFFVTDVISAFLIQNRLRNSEKLKN